MEIKHREMTPSVHPDAYVAPTAVLSGQVSVGAGSCVLHGAVLTADGGPVEVGATAPVPEVDVDQVRIGEVLANLLTNAIRHTPRGGSVRVAVGPAPAGVAFAVSDTGPGIGARDLPHVFDRFVKSADSGGAGLGLAIARSLVEAHGGRISAESAPGQGTTMRFVLPAVEDFTGSSG